MTWVLWRQHRVQALTVVGFLLSLGVYLLLAGKDAGVFLSWLPLAPLLVGVFWGAPLLARELERGTHRLAWTQSVTRRRWLVAKLGWLGLGVTVAGLVLGWMVDAWVAEVGHNRFGNTEFFGATGVLSGVWWLFAFLLGAASGALLRRLLPALAVTVAGFVLVLFALVQLRQDYAEPVPALADRAPEGAMMVGATWLDRSGAEVEEPPMCLDVEPSLHSECARAAGYRFAVQHHPADRYWRFQWTETGILLLGAVLLAGSVAYRVLRRPV